MRVRLAFTYLICFLTMSIVGCSNKNTQDVNTPRVTQSPITNNENDTIIDNSADKNMEAGNEAESKEVDNLSNQSNTDNPDDQEQDVNNDAENEDNFEYNDIDLVDPDVKADDYYIYETIDSYYYWFAYAVSSSGEEAKDAINFINELLYEPDSELSKKIIEWIDTERTHIKEMKFSRGGYESEIQYISDNELYVKVDAVYEIIKDDNTEDEKLVTKTFYLIEINNYNYKIKDIQDAE